MSDRDEPVEEEPAGEESQEEGDGLLWHITGTVILPDGEKYEVDHERIAASRSDVVTRAEEVARHGLSLQVDTPLTWVDGPEVSLVDDGAEEGGDDEEDALPPLASLDPAQLKVVRRVFQRAKDALEHEHEKLNTLLDKVGDCRSRIVTLTKEVSEFEALLPVEPVQGRLL